MFNKQLDIESVSPLTGHDVRRQQDRVDYVLSLGGGTSSARPGESLTIWVENLRCVTRHMCMVKICRCRLKHVTFPSIASKYIWCSLPISILEQWTILFIIVNVIRNILTMTKLVLTLMYCLPNVTIGVTYKHFKLETPTRFSSAVYILCSSSLQSHSLFQNHSKEVPPSYSWHCTTWNNFNYDITISITILCRVYIIFFNHLLNSSNQAEWIH